MRAVVVPTPGGPSALRIVERPEPTPGPGEVVVRVAGSSVNRADAMQREGRYPPPDGAGDVLGLEVAGTVAAVGDGVEGVAEGDRVCSLLAAGGYAERAVVPAATLIPVPEGVDLVHAGGFAEVACTAWDNVVTRGRLRAGETLLVHGGSSGVGTAAVQIARALGARVLVTASTEAKRDACRRLGADVAIDYTTADIPDAVAEATGGRGVDVILDMVGAEYLDVNLRCLARDGRLVVIGLQSGTRAELDMGRLLTRRLSVAGSTLRARTVEQKAAVARAVTGHVVPWWADGRYAVVVDRVVDLDDVVAAHEALEQGEHIGKIILRVA